MILVDTSIWVDHLRRHDGALAALLEAGNVMMHPHLIGELALGSLRNRSTILQALQDLPEALVASEEEALIFIHKHRLQSMGIGYTDAHLLASARLSGGRLWTRDKKLASVAQSLGLNYTP